MAGNGSEGKSCDKGAPVAAEDEGSTAPLPEKVPFIFTPHFSFLFLGFGFLLLGRIMRWLLIGCVESG